MRIGQVEVMPTVKEVIREFGDDEVPELAAAAAFRLILALPPLIIFFAALSSLVARYTGVDAFQEIQEQLQQAPIPGSVRETLQLLLDTVRQEGSPGLLSLGILLALWAGSGATETMMKTFNRAYDTTEARSFVKRRLVAIGLTVGLSLLTITAFVLFVFGERLGQWLAEQIGLGPTFALVWNLARWPAIVVFVMFALAILYWAGPALDISFRWISPGAALATLLWLVAAWGFSLYLRFSNPGSAYGAMGALIVLLFFLYVSSIVLLIGAELNAVIDKRHDPKVIQAKAAHPERQTDPEAAQARARALAERQGGPAAAAAQPLARRHPRRPARGLGVLLTGIAWAALFAAAVARAVRRH